MIRYKTDTLTKHLNIVLNLTDEDVLMNERDYLTVQAKVSHFFNAMSDCDNEENAVRYVSQLVRDAFKRLREKEQASKPGV